MRQAKPTKHKAAADAVPRYLARVPKPARSAFNKLRATIRSAVPRDAVETVSYGILAFRRRKVLVWFGAFSTHCSLFPTAEIIADFKDHLKNYKTSKGTIQFPLDRPLPILLIKRMIKARVAKAED
jgi:uncharacterized protein YdhG (YjbR/CyaY superfamily)